ncbi:amidohydrolase [Actinomadura parmotrematis]|uniref:Amidohydrolase n=1 Tax=Actinomadura parmotrematis TaxID=2864039 RepID=A0ABS7G3A5_9ACTN|nr:amidohydrolase [Actinomadura parmotrematis]MBW8487205.1 amidohydrolase [Actinomadura parmotrematis]
MSDRPAETTREVLEDLTGHLPELTALYRDLHAHPEPSWREHRTAASVAARLAAAGFAVTEKVGGTGVVGVLRNGDGPVVLLRGDMDALPIAERTGLPYASTVPGVMHACGHDLHVTCLAGTAEALARRRALWSGTLMVVAQPAEEIGEGAQAMLADGLYGRFARPDVVLGQHVGPFPVGSIVHRPGLLMSASTTLDVRIPGTGGHGALPELCVDPVVTAAHLVTRLQTIVSRETAPSDAVVLTTGVLRAGTQANVIPDEAYLALNLRTQSAAARDRVLAAVRRIAEAECAAAGAPRPPEITVTGEFPLTLNDPGADAAVSAAHTGLFGAEAVIEHGPLMGSEDFPYFGMADHAGGAPIPSAFWFFGGTSAQAWERAPGETPEEKLRGIPGNHNSRFAPDGDTALPAGITALTAAALAHLA